jgi:sugar lactone lactonase YvrE
MSSRFDRYRPVDPVVAAGWSIETIVEPSALFSSNGIRIGPDGLCWIAEQRAGSISVWDPERDEISTRVPIGGPTTGPDDLAIAEDGSFYLTEFLEDRVDGYRADGSYVLLTEESPRANGITLTRDGRLFVDEFRAGGRLYELETREPFGMRVIAEIEFPNGLDEGPDGRLYVPDVVGGVIYAVDPDSGDMEPLAEGFEMPSAVKIHSGRAIVAEHLTGDVHAVDLETKKREVLASLPPGCDNVCFDAAGRLYVSDAIAAYVVRFAGGRIDKQTQPGLLGPYGMTPTKDGAVLVADQARILEYGSGEPRILWTRRYPDRTFSNLEVALVGRRLLVVTDAGEVRHVDPDLDTHAVVLAADDSPFLAIAPHGDGALAGREDGTVLEIRADGSVVTEWKLGLGTATRVTSDASTVVACDASTGTVAVSAGDEVTEYDGWKKPVAVAAGPGLVFVVEQDEGRVSELDLGSGNRSAVVSGLPFGFPMPRSPRDRRSSIVREDDGSLLVGCDGDGSIRRLRRA